MRERFFGQAWHATLPLLVWAAHFAVCYTVVAAQCSPALAQGKPSVAWLWMASALALGLCLMMLWRARGCLTRKELTGSASLVQLAHAGGALLALAGIAWTSVPLLLLDGCG